MLVIHKIIKMANIIPKINLFSIYNNNTVQVGYTGPKKGDHLRFWYAIQNEKIWKKF